MWCPECTGEIHFAAHEFEGYVDLWCSCRRIMIPILGVVKNGEPSYVNDQPAGVAADPGGSGEAAGRDDSVAAPERIEEAEPTDKNDGR